MKLLELRNQIKKKKPDFVRQEIYRRKKLKRKWRAPKGMHSKLRRKFRGHLKQPSVGYSSPRKVRGLTRDGYKKVLVHNLAELNKIKEEAVELSRTLGKRKKLELLKKIKESKLKVTNIKDVSKAIKLIEDKLAERKKAVKEKEKKKKEKEKAKPKKPEKKKEISKEEKEKKEKEEKRKILEAK